MTKEYKITMDNVTVTNGAVVNNGTITNTVYNNASPADAALLQDLADAQKKLADLAPKIADAIGELSKAVEKKDQKKIREKVAELTSGTVAEIVKSVAGAAMVRFLGLS